MEQRVSASDSFWDFSLAFYALPDVAPSFLQLQDECAADVNVMLFLLYLADAGRILEPAEVAGIDRLAAPWRSAVVAPLRAVRRALKEPVGPFDAAGSAALRAEVKRIELAAEKRQQQTLEACFPAHRTGTKGVDRLSCARSNLSAYACCIGPLAPAALDAILARFASFSAKR